jgi:hypothetical protein
MQKQIQGFILSPQQRRLWLLQQDSQIYQVHCAILLEGNLQIEVLKTALHQVINRHEILRTTFHCTRGIKIPIQVINEPTILSLNEYCFENKQALGVEIEKLFQAMIQQHFDWEKGPILQTTLATLSPQQHLLLVSLPALCADAPTLNNLVRELSKCYAASLQSEVVIEQPLQYPEIAEWLNELLEVGDSEVETDYWGKLDISSLSDLRLPFSNQQTDNSEFQPQWFTREIAPDLVAKINAITQDEKINQNVFFITCWQILLWRLTEQSDIVIGTVSDGRSYEELQESLGLLVKYLPLLCHLEGGYKFNKLLVRVAEAITEISEWQESFCWEKSVELENNPTQLFFPFCFEFESLSAKHLADDVYFSIYQQYTCIDKFQVKLTCVSRDDSIALEFHYDANVLALKDVQRLANQFETLLASVVNNPEGAIATFDIISPDERQQLLDFNNTQTTILPYQCIHHWFELQTQRTPENIAVGFQSQELTYTELNARANQLAHHLQQQGIGPDVLVGICVERSLEMVIGVLGILKAGGAYVPIDPNLSPGTSSFYS